LRQPLLRLGDRLLHLRGLGGRVRLRFALGVRPETAVAGDVAEGDGEFWAGEGSIESFGTQPPRIEAGHLQRVANGVR
jgi:hypothetical protein